MNLLLCGAGSVGVELLRRLGERWRVTIVDKDAIVLLAVFTCLLGPSLFKLLHRPTGQEPAMAGEEKRTATGRRDPDRIAAGKS